MPVRRPTTPIALELPPKPSVGLSPPARQSLAIDDLDAIKKILTPQQIENQTRR